MKSFLTFFLQLFLFLEITSFAFAEGDATIILNPKNPTPNSQVTATVQSYSFDVDTAMITWSSGSTIILKGYGEKKVTVQTGSVGYQIPLHANIRTADGSVTDININLTPNSVDILYEATESYTPLFYEGKALPGEGAAVTFSALPNIGENGIIIPEKSLAYSWYLNDVFMENNSGMGKSKATFNLDFFEKFTRVKVVARSIKGTYAEKYIDIYPHEIMPLLYLHDEILGSDFTKVINRRFETTKDFTLSLEPFFFSTKNGLENYAKYSWYLDGLSITPLGGRLLSMKPKENSYGSRNLSISVSNSKRRLQKATTDLNLIFDTRK